MHFQSGLILMLFLFAARSFGSDEILGCGGFVKSHADIDFSHITVKLYTKSGSLKDQTECAPNTGYYFIPVYDKGEYILKLEPPRGWSFDPVEVALSIDGSGKDICSQGKDINFVFKGFGITGKVLASFKPEFGPKGITVSLYDEHNTTQLASTTTSEGGTFSFTPVQPGKYVLIATHPIWFIEKYTTTVQVKEGNSEIKNGDLSVFGFDVSGRVTTTDGDPVGKVSFLLFGNGRTKNCATNPVEGIEIKKKPLCHVTSDENGGFVFPVVSPGNYTLKPYYTGSKTKFDVKPSELSFSVEKNSLILPQEFKVTGFTISGKVMASIKPEIPIVGAKVFLSKKQIAITDNNGAYKTDNIKATQYSLYAKADDVLFEETPVRVSPSNPELPIITPVAFKVSGKVSSSTKANLEGRKILIKNESSKEQQEIEINANTDEWNVFLAPSTYQLSVIVDENEKSKGLQFFPMQRVIDVAVAPIRDVNFLQLKATLKGSIVCLPDKDSKNECSQTQITLKMLDSTESKTVKAKGSEYIFEDILPGQYELIIDADIFCWDITKQHIVIASEKPPNPLPFRQTGYSVTFISSHDTKVEYSVPSQQNKKTYLQLLKGSTRHCISMPGKYEFFPKGCHKYAKTSFLWNTNERTPIILSSTEHTQSGSIISPLSVEGVSVKIVSESDGQSPILRKNLKSILDGDKYKYTFSFDATTGETYLISPLSEFLLFDPPSLKVTGPEDCLDNLVTFKAEQGKIISGAIYPPLEGIVIKIFGLDKEVPVHILVTQKNGSFKVGPLDGSIEYSITAEKEGYVFTRDSSAKDYKFLARKLAEIIIDIVDIAGSIPLQGVLLSLSGSNGGSQSYRKNLVTSEEGRVTFNSLSPGEYYLRPTMKEYRFEPTSMMIRVDEGKSMQAKVKGRRVAFSAYGTVSCLNGEPEPGLIVEARGQAECSHLQEEATTKEDGSWRIRGLEPKCMYAIRIKLNDQDPSMRGLRAIPSSVAIQASQDIFDIKLMALQPVLRTDISVRILTNHPENYRTLKVKLCREDQPDSPVHILKLDGQFYAKLNNAGSILHFPPLQADGKKYFVQLETTLSKSTHDFEIKPVYFLANTSFKYAELHFMAERRHDHGDTGQITFFPLPLILLVSIAFYNREALSAWLNTTIEKWSRKSSTKSYQAQQNLLAASDLRVDELIAEQIKNINAKSSKKIKPRKA